MATYSLERGGEAACGLVILVHRVTGLVLVLGTSVPVFLHRQGAMRWEHHKFLPTQSDCTSHSLITGDQQHLPQLLFNHVMSTK